MQFKLFESSDPTTIERQMNRWAETEGKGVQIMSVTTAIGQKEIPGGNTLKTTCLIVVTVCFKK